MILVVALVFVEREVLVEVLNIGTALIGCVVALGAVVAVWGVALRVVDILISSEDVEALAVVVGTAEIVVVVVCGVCPDRVEDCLADLTLNLGEKVLIAFERLLLAVVEPVEA